MKTLNIYLLILIMVIFASCDDITDINVSPNGADPSGVNPNLMVSTVITQTAIPYLEMNYGGDVGGVMQHHQKSGWSGGSNNFAWLNERSMASNYSTLRNIQHLYNRAGTEGMEFQQGLALVLRAWNFGHVADCWGDAPYSAALNASAGGQENYFPVYDSQEDIYKGIIGELKEANTLLSKTSDAYVGINSDADIMYNGNPLKWRKMANSLMLRYYMRVSSKLPTYAKSGIEEIISNPQTYPIFTSNDDDATIGFIGSSQGDSWPRNLVNDVDATNTSFSRLQMAAGFRDVLMDFNDPRIGVWFNKVVIPIKVSDAYGDDVVFEGVRYIDPDFMAANDMVIYNSNTWPSDVESGKVIIDTLDYVGIPIASSLSNNTYNLNPNTIQGGSNVHVSALSDMYKEPTGDMLKARLISYSEVCFILAEAAKTGMSVGAQQDWYENGIKASLETWGVGNSYDTYVNNSGVVYDGSLEQIMTQKWIANWTVAFEAWFDWRRTGLPELAVGPFGERSVMPIRFIYDASEKSRNVTNVESAISKLETTNYVAQDGKDSPWSKVWLIQGTGEPY